MTCLDRELAYGVLAWIDLATSRWFLHQKMHMLHLFLSFSRALSTTLVLFFRPVVLLPRIDVAPRLCRRLLGRFVFTDIDTLLALLISHCEHSSFRSWYSFVFCCLNVALSIVLVLVQL